MPILPIDIVLLPEKSISDYCISLNKTLTKTYTLWSTNNIPHCSLFKGCVDSELLPETLRIIQKNFFELSWPIIVTPTTYKAGFVNEWKTASISFNNTSQIESLQTTLFESLQDVILYDSSLASFPESVNQLTHDRIKKYPKTLADKSWLSHISLWFGEIDEKQFPLPETIIFDRIALTWMWNRCRSYEIIEEFTLSI